MITFDPETHTYYRDGVKTDSVTQILTMAGKIKTQFYKPGKSERGTAVHEATEQMDLMGFGKNMYPEEIHGFLDAWVFLKNSLRFKVLEIEQILDHPELDYAGTCDRVVLYEGKLYVLDIKTGVKADWHRLQLAGYGLPIPGCVGGIVAYLKEDGKGQVAIRHPQDFRMDTIEWCQIAKERIKK
jgi:hypothetical protein